MGAALKRKKNTVLYRMKKIDLSTFKIFKNLFLFINFFFLFTDAPAAYGNSGVSKLRVE